MRVGGRRARPVNVGRSRDARVTGACTHIARPVGCDTGAAGLAFAQLHLATPEQPSGRVGPVLSSRGMSR
jgi:hypothetical protein